jgi:hypothetical protein
VFPWLDHGALQVERILNRQDLAMKIYVHGEYGPKDSFAVADRFIAECERQRKHPEPPKCERIELIENAEYDSNGNLCKVKPAPKREARSFKLVVYPNGKFEPYSDDAMQFGTGAKAVYVREIIE